VQLCSAVRDILSARRVSVLVYDASSEAIAPLVSDQPSDERFEEIARKWSRIPLQSFGAAAEALRDQVPVVIDDAQRDERLPPGLAADLGATSLHLEPLAMAEPVGLLAIEPASAAANGDLQAVIPLVAASVARAAPPAEAPRVEAEADFLLELLEAASREESLAGVLGTICERVAARAGGRRAFAFLLEDGRAVPRLAAYADGSRDPDIGERLAGAPAPFPLVESVLESGSPVVADEPESPLVSGWWAETFDIANAIAAPIGRAPAIVGVLTVDDARPGQLGTEQLRVVSAAAARVGGVIERALALEERTSNLQAATAVRELLEGGARAETIEEAAETLARVARETLQVDQASVFLTDGEGRIHYAGLDLRERFEAVVRERLVGSQAAEFRLWRRVVRHRKAIFVDDAHQSQLIPLELVTLLGLRSYAAFPLVSDDRPLGLVVCSDTQRRRHWSEEERALVDQLSLEGSLIVENAALRAAERERIDELSRQAFHDPLTDLPNRSLFADRLDHALARLRRRHQSVAVLLLDLDGFKEINDTLGHEAGDQLLVAVAERLRACLRPADTVARLGGDEFTILLEEITQLREATRVAERIKSALATPFVLDGREWSVTASIGIALNTPEQGAPDELMRSADTAMYQAKRAGKARYEVFEPRPNPTGVAELTGEESELTIRRASVTGGPEESGRESDGDGSPPLAERTD
jgi:diguanylate cyclase (GGDEF)-like protein